MVGLAGLPEDIGTREKATQTIVFHEICLVQSPEGSCWNHERYCGHGSSA